MTKKSLNRIMRDQEKKEKEQELNEKVDLENNACWDELTEIYKSCGLSLTQNVELVPYLRDMELMSFVENRELLIQNVEQITRDIQQMKDELAKIYSNHSSRTGGATSGTDLLTALNIYEHYNLFTVRFEAVIMPTVNHILEQINAADAKRQNKLNETNVDVITDVEVKEVQTTEGN